MSFPAFTAFTGFTVDPLQSQQVQAGLVGFQYAQPQQQQLPTAVTAPAAATQTAAANTFSGFTASGFQPLAMPQATIPSPQQAASFSIPAASSVATNVLTQPQPAPAGMPLRTWAEMGDFITKHYVALGGDQSATKASQKFDDLSSKGLIELSYTPKAQAILEQLQQQPQQAAQPPVQQQPQQAAQPPVQQQPQQAAQPPVQQQAQPSLQDLQTQLARIQAQMQQVAQQQQPVQPQGFGFNPAPAQQQVLQKAQ